VVKYSVIVPAYNEIENIPQLLKLLSQELNDDYEVIIVDDGSTDGTWELLRELSSRYKFLKSVRHPRNLGKTEAILSGANLASGQFLVIFDADLQYQPSDIPRFIEELERGYDMCVGWKQGRYQKRLVSSIYNFLARKIFSLSVHDINAMKAFRKEVLTEISLLRKDWHRYLVPLAHDKGFKITELKVKLLPRYRGIPKYQSPFRVLIGFFDLLAVGFQIKVMRKPMFYLGLLGSAIMFLGVIVGVGAVILRILGHGFRPLLYLVILLVLAGLLILGFGFIGEAVAHIAERLERIEKTLKNNSKD
jgi:glycosyltransferase involved in cell wall biosynthesis